MSGIVFPALVLVTWVAIGLASVLFLERHGRRSAAWFAIGAVLGPILLPIAVELAASQGTLLKRRPQQEGRPARMTALVAVDGSAESDEALSDAAAVLAQALLGSVADQVVRRSSRPVLLGRAPARHG